MTDQSLAMRTAPLDMNFTLADKVLNISKQLIDVLEDGTVKVWENDSGALILTLNKRHTGWVTGICYDAELRLLTSCSLDSTIHCYLPKKDGKRGFNCVQVLNVGTPLFCMAWEYSRGKLLCGSMGVLHVFMLNADNIIQEKDFLYAPEKTVKIMGAHDPTLPESQQPMITKKIPWTLNHHIDIITAVACVDAKVFTVGLDRRLCVTEAETIAEKGHEPKTKIIEHAHAAGITAIAYDSNNNFVATGGHDNVVRIWTFDGKLLQSYDVPKQVTGMCFFRYTNTLWVATDKQRPTIFHIPTASEVTQFVLTDDMDPEFSKGEAIVKVFYNHDVAELVAITHRRHIKFWRYNPSGSVTVLKKHTDIIEALALVRVVPPTPSESVQLISEATTLQLLSAGRDGNIIRWEPQQLNNYVFTVETLGIKQGHITCMTYCHENDMVVAGFENGYMRLWNYWCKEPIGRVGGKIRRQSRKESLISSSPYQTATFMTEVAKTASPVSAAFSRTVDILYVCRELEEHDFGCMAHSGPVTHMLCYKDMLITIGGDGKIRGWITQNATLIHDIVDAHDGHPILDIGLAVERGEFATVAGDEIIRVWDCDTFECKTKILQDSFVSHIKWNKFHQGWVTGGEDGILVLWSLDGFKRCIMENHSRITALCIEERTGHIAAATANERSIVLWDPILQEVMVTYRGHTDEIRVLVYIAERNQFASASWDGTVRLWRAAIPPTARITYSDQIWARLQAASPTNDEEEDRPPERNSEKDIERTHNALDKVFGESPHVHVAKPRDIGHLLHTDIDSMFSESLSRVKLQTKVVTRTQVLRQRAGVPRHMSPTRSFARGVNMLKSSPHPAPARTVTVSTAATNANKLKSSPSPTPSFARGLNMLKSSPLPTFVRKEVS